MHKIYYFIIITLLFNSTFATNTFSRYLTKASQNKKISETLPPHKVEKIKDNSFNKSISNYIKLSYITKPISFVYNNSGKLLSKNTLATVMILGAPYIYLTDTNILSYIATITSDMTFKISEAAMSGMLKAAFNNKIIITKLASIFAAKFVTSEAAKSGVGGAIKYGTAVLGAFVRYKMGWKAYADVVK